jgi:hypothetical protein
MWCGEADGWRWGEKQDRLVTWHGRSSFVIFIPWDLKTHVLRPPTTDDFSIYT